MEKTEKDREMTEEKTCEIALTGEADAAVARLLDRLVAEMRTAGRGASL